ncbi:MAG: hypothetical protein ACRDTR_20265 [Rubrobacter sp.]
MGLKEPSVRKVQPAQAQRKVSLTAGKDLRRTGSLVVAAGLLLLALAAGDALAGVELGGPGDDALRGAAQDDRLGGFGGRDGVWGRAGDDGLSGGAGGDELYGGPGRDEFYGGAGDDFLEAKDGWQDHVHCGPGHDAASVDPGDLVSLTCEAVYQA